MANATIEAVEKSNVMEDHYKESTDPWGNRERQLYQKVLKYGSSQLYKYYSETSPHPTVRCYDIGCGGGNILDTLLENKPDNLEIILSGCDISESAIEFLNKHFSGYARDFKVIDCEEYSSNNPDPNLNDADIITIVDVMYYWGNKRDYRKSLDEIWSTLKPGAIVLVADSIIPYQRRSYFKSKSDCKVLEEYTEYCMPMGKLNDTNKNRYLKVKIYQKIKE